MCHRRKIEGFKISIGGLYPNLHKKALNRTFSIINICNSLCKIHTMRGDGTPEKLVIYHIIKEAQVRKKTRSVSIVEKCTPQVISELFPALVE